MPVELHHLNDEVPGSSPGGSNMWGHSSMVEHEVSSKPCRRAFIVAAKDTEDREKIPMNRDVQSLENDRLAFDLAALGYPGFSYLTACSKRDPTEFVLAALQVVNLDSRVVEALPWVL